MASVSKSHSIAPLNRKILKSQDNDERIPRGIIIAESNELSFRLQADVHVLYMRTAVEPRLLTIDGECQVADDSCHLIAHRLADL